MRRTDKDRKKDSQTLIAAEHLCCDAKSISFFTELDPLNPFNEVSGARSSSGDLLFFSVNNRVLSFPTRIYGSPHIKPLTNSGIEEITKHKNFINCKTIFFSNKWNGTSVTVYKYQNDKDETFVSVTQRGNVFLRDTSVCQLLTEVLHLLGVQPFAENLTVSINDLPSSLILIKDPHIQSITFELCGFKYPEFVAYNRSSELIPLYCTTNDGRIRPWIESHETGGTLWSHRLFLAHDIETKGDQGRKNRKKETKSKRKRESSEEESFPTKKKKKKKKKKKHSEKTTA
eukprot:TRINITY_DN16008_c0_g1_i1.p1 TRINITY_DN16008_c0_g1~~TRINITY_DN16008_c0_g1_i1.p1  ORF type:complete len:287 (-),score=40.81 TRINITY_DN16008_c0_g1_i1:141-1001(-)